MKSLTPIVVAHVLLALFSSLASAKNARPNVIFVLTDDLGYSDISCYGATKVKTPHIDRLAAEGIQFTDFHTAASICSPSRAAFLTGAYPQRAGLYMGINPNRTAHWFLGLNPDEITLAEQFKSQGYRTSMVGKWHLGTEPEFSMLKQGFDDYYGMPCNFSHDPRFLDGEEVVFEKTPLDQLTELYTDRITTFIREQKDEPFFLYYAHNYPHTPYQAGEKFKGSSKDGVRGDIMQELDWSIGEMMSALEEAGIAENTLVVFTSDNGPTSNKYALPYRGTKYVTLEGGHRVPFILHWPVKITEPRVSDVPVNAMDLFPTLSEIIGASMAQDRKYDGESLMPLLDGEPLARSADTPFYYYNCENLQAVRVTDWKLHLPREAAQVPFWEKNKAFFGLKAPVLYDLSADPGESTDVAAQHPEVVAQLMALAEETREDLGEYLERGSGQRPAGTVIPDAPIISHEKDWGMVDAAVARGIAEERQRRHAQTATPKKTKKRGPRAAPSLKSAAATAEQPPNVIFIFADDLGYGDLSCYGATKVQTPHIDSLAKDGRRFTDAHSASAVCTPSRYSLLTGEYPLRGNEGRGIWGPLSHTSGLIIDPQKTTLGQIFKDSGYSTACIGKWHLGFGEGPCDWNKPLRPGPLELGFDYYFGVPKVNSGFPYVYVENDRIVGWDPEDPLVFKGKPISPTPTFPPEAGKKTGNAFAGAVEAHKIYDDERTATLLTKKAVTWIGENKENPFFLYLPTTNIHHPFTPAPRFKGTSQCGLYGDFIHELDWMVGALLKCLDENGLADNTLVIFTSDNGGMFNVGGQAAWDAGHQLNGELLGYKFGAWEGGHRIPFIARWPGKIEAGSTSDQLIVNTDMAATMAALTGHVLEEGQARDSVNVLPALVGDPTDSLRDHVVLAASKPSHLSIRKGSWMYIGAQGSGGFTAAKRGAHAFGGPAAIAYAGRENSDVENGKIKQDAPPAQLYDLENDLAQTQNLYREYPEIVKELSALLESHRTPKPERPTPVKGQTTSEYDGFKPLGALRFTFESGKLDGWSIVEGKVGLPVSDRPSLPRQKDRPFHREGKFHLSTIATADGTSDEQQVVFQSPEFVIHGDLASFLASGGFIPGSLYVGLIDANSKEILLTAGGSRGPQMKRTTWDVSKLKGRTVVLQVVDQSSDGWGHLTFDDFSIDGSLEPATKPTSR